MSPSTLSEQLEAVRAELFPQNPVSAEKAKETARNLSSLVPKALDRELRRYLQANRQLPISEQRQWLEFIVAELVSTRKEFFVHDISEKLRKELRRVAGEAYDQAVRYAKESARAHDNEKRETHHGEQWRRDASSYLAAMSSLAVEIERPLKPLGERDLELCLVWADRSVRQGESALVQWNVFRKVDPNESLKLWSARSAEIAAISVLADLGKQTKDISICQLHRVSDSWKTHDAEVDGEPIDVKNARPSFSSPNSYVEHTIPRFKQAFRTHSDVTILGVLSDYVPWTRIDNGLYGSSKILGQLRHRDLQALSSWMKKHFGDILDFSLISQDQLPTYPGWLFEYPDGWYLRRAEAIDGIRRLLNECPDPALPQQSLPLWTSAFADASAHVSVGGSYELDVEVFRQFVTLRDEIGISRRSTFAWVLGLMLRTLLKDGDAAAVCDTAAALRRLLFRSAKGVVDRASGRRPAGLFDPMGYVSSLISLFEQIGNAIPLHLIRSMRFFKLSAPTILRGQLASGEWQTVFAHCGGWRRQPFAVPCGNNPIHLGNADLCSECGFLICGECGHCMSSCSAYASRLNQAGDAEIGPQGVAIS